MLANGTKLGYSKTDPSDSSTSYTDLPGLKEIPDVGTDPEKVDNTVLTDKHKVYEKGIGDGIFTHKHSKKIKKIMNIRSWKQNLPITGTSADGGLMNLTDEGSRESRTPATRLQRVLPLS